MSRHKSSPAETLLGLLIGALVAFAAIVYHVYTQRPDPIPTAENSEDDRNH